MMIQTTKKENDCYEIEVYDVGLQCLVAVANVLGIFVDEEKMRARYFGKEIMDTQIILQSAQFLKLKEKVIKPKQDELVKLPIPAIAVMRDGAYKVIGQNNAEKILLFDPQARRPETIAMEDFLTIWGGEIITIKKRFSLKEAGRQFNLAWFIPVILKYKHFFIEVLLAPFFLQVVY